MGGYWQETGGCSLVAENGAEVAEELPSCEEEGSCISRRSHGSVDKQYSSNQEHEKLDLQHNGSHQKDSDDNFLVVICFFILCTCSIFHR